MTSLPDPCRHPLPPIYTHVGDAHVSYVPGHWAAEVLISVCGQPPITCAASDARDLIAALQQALSDPLVESYRARNAARLAGGAPDGR